MQMIRGASLALTLLTAGAASAEDLIKATMYKMPHCGCCEGHAEYLRENGFEVEIKETADLTPIRRAEGVPAQLEGCHTILIDGLVVEGHVSAETIRRFLSERPAGVEGLAMKGIADRCSGNAGTEGGTYRYFCLWRGRTDRFHRRVKRRSIDLGSPWSRSKETIKVRLASRVRRPLCPAAQVLQRHPLLPQPS